MSKTPVTRRGTASMIEEAKDASRSHAEWKKVDKKTLVSKCKKYHLSTEGSKRTLISRLLDKFRKEDLEREENETLDFGGAAPALPVQGLQTISMTTLRTLTTAIVRHVRMRGGRTARGVIFLSLVTTRT